MKRTHAALVYLLLPFALATAKTTSPVWFDPPLSPRIANYDIDVRLDPQAKLLTAREVIRWRNATSKPTNTLQFHLYMNAFRNSESTFMREVSAKSRYAKRKPEDWGWVEIDTLLLGGTNLLPASQFIQPDDGNAQDRTVLQVQLPKPVRPGESIELQVAFRTKLPRIFARTGWEKDDFFFVGQWFPKLGVLEESGWNCHQFHRNSEFYSDFGVYNVRITVPKRFVVGATGQRVAEESLADTAKVLTYHAEDVHDFAWTASPEYVVFIDSLYDTRIRLLLLKGHEHFARRHFDAARTAMRYYHDWYGPYPYPVLTIVDTKGRAGGMEYPTLITAGFLFGPYLPEGLRFIENVVIHEFGHQYWYGMVANNEFEEAWLDEGLNTYSETRTLARWHGPVGNLVDLLGVKLSDLELQRMQVQSFPPYDPMKRFAWKFVSNRSYSRNVYSKAVLFLTTLERWFGEKRWLGVMRTYFERWKFKHPHSRDFLAVVNEVTGTDSLNHFYSQVLNEPGYLDYAVDKVTVWKDHRPVGVDFDSTASDSGEAEASQADSASADSTVYWAEVLLHRLGNFQFPVRLLLRFEDGDSLWLNWDGVETWRKFRVKHPARLDYAVIDPDKRVQMDLDFLNNSKTVEPRKRGVRKLTLRWLFWVQSLLHMASFIS